MPTPSLGQIYTPRPVADLMVALAGAPDGLALEPACGPGVFLEALAAAGWEQVMGVDIDPANVAAARSALGTRAQVECGDFLEHPTPSPALVIGNPPYVSWPQISDETRRILREDPAWRDITDGGWDLFYAFLIEGARRLAPGGRMVMIIPDPWLASTHAQALRDHLATEGALERVILFDEVRVFADAAISPMIIVWRKAAPPGTVAISRHEGRRGNAADAVRQLAAQLDGGDAPRHEGRWRHYRAAHPGANARWSFPAHDEAEALGVIEAGCRASTLADWCDIGIGAVSGCAEVFHLSPDADVEPGATTGAVLAPAIARYRLCAPEPVLMPGGDEGELRRMWPRAHAYLARHRAQLEGRTRPGGRAWFEWATPRNLALFATHARTGKVFLPAVDRTDRPRPGYCTHEAIGAGDITMVAPHLGSGLDPRVVLAWLASDHMAAWWRAHGSRTGGRSRFGPRVVGAMPFPALDLADADQAALCAQISRAVQDRLEAGDASVQKEREAVIEAALSRLLAGCATRLSREAGAARPAARTIAT